MEDKEIKELFRKYTPVIGDDNKFMEDLTKRMRTVEIVEKHNQRYLRNARNAMIFAACVGFVCGFLFSLALPYIGKIAADIIVSVPQDKALHIMAQHYSLISWMIIAVLTGMLSMNSYNVYMASSIERDTASF